MTKQAGQLVRFLTRYGIIMVLAVELIYFSFRSENFLTIDNQLNVLRQNAVIAIIACGMTFVILTAGIDLSVGSLVAIAGVVCADILKHDWAPVGTRVAVGLVAGVACGAFGGFINGLVSTKMRIPPFVATLAMLTIGRGIALQYTDSRSISGLPDLFGEFGIGVWPVIIMAVVVLISWIVLTRTPFGRHVYAVGGNVEAARLCGIRTDRVLIKVYLISGLLAGLGGVLMAARLNSGDPKLGTLYELDAIAAVVVGGTSLMGGRGSIWGTLIGAFVIGELNNGLNLLGVEYYSQKIVVGIVLILAAFLDRFRAERAY
jgi:ribose/xylose/arabinose/galactoside ABC-type transport system permease subunit